jgi:hypothetical protein
MSERPNDDPRAPTPDPVEDARLRRDKEQAELMDDARDQFLLRAADRRKRLANLTSPEFDAWFEQQLIACSDEPFLILEKIMLEVRAQQQLEFRTTCELQPSLG